jgi:hypothetical protein
MAIMTGLQIANEEKTSKNLIILNDCMSIVDMMKYKTNKYLEWRNREDEGLTIVSK